MPGLITPEYCVKLMDPTLVWLPEYGIGYYPPPKNARPIYNGEYWDKYNRYAQTELGLKLTKARIAFVNKYHTGSLLDYGIGSGQFLSMRGKTEGWDINPEALKWLVRNSLLGSPEQDYPAISFWDSLEHLEDPAKALEHVEEWAFISIPIFRDLDHIRSSKHFRPGEHVWYFTHQGLEKYMSYVGFRIVESSYMESDLGREDIVSFAFHRP